MSEQLIQVFLGDTPIHLDAQDEGEPQLLWKVVLRTGTWKLRPGPGGVKLNAPLKIFRDKAPKSHVSLAALKQNFEAPAKENVTVPMVHADGTTSDGGFVKKLVIQDVPGENGKGTKESLLWAGMEITDSELKRKLDEKSIRGVSGGILFDYERPRDAKKFDQVLSHVMVTNSPWIDGTGDFHDKLPEGVMASEPDDLPMGEVEFSSRETDPQPELPVVALADPPAPAQTGTTSTGDVLWKPEQGFRYAQRKIQDALRSFRDSLMASVPVDQRYTLDWPMFSADDVSLSGDSGTALICSGYGSDKDSWVAGFKLDAKGDVELDPFVNWKPAKQEWVAASEDSPPAPKARQSARPAARSAKKSALQEAQEARVQRMGLGTTTNTTTGGHMGRLTDLLHGVDLSDEQREEILAEERRIANLEESENERRQRARQAEIVDYCGSADGQTKGKLDKLALGDPGVKKYVRDALLSDDGGAAIEYVVHLDDGTQTKGKPMTATELLKGFIDILPKAEDGRVSLAEQARRVPDDVKPKETAGDEKADPKANADAFLEDLQGMGIGSDLVAAAARKGA